MAKKRSFKKNTSKKSKKGNMLMIGIAAAIAGLGFILYRRNAEAKEQAAITEAQNPYTVPEQVASSLLPYTPQALEMPSYTGPSTAETVASSLPTSMNAPIFETPLETSSTEYTGPVNIAPQSAMPGFPSYN